MTLSLRALGVLALGLLLHPTPPLAAQDLTERLALQTWTARKLSFEEMTDFAQRVGIPTLQMWSSRSGGHMDPLGPWETIEKQKQLLDQKGLKVYAFGVTRATRTEEDLRKTFELARYLGMEMVITEPTTKRELDLLERFATVYDIKVAVHNHTIDSPFGNPVTAQMLLEGRDPRVGFCLDAGWMSTTGLDVVEVFKEYGDRVLDIHLKDKIVEDAAAHQFRDVDIGTGEANLAGLLQAMKETGYTGRLAIETDQELQDPTAFVKGAMAFVEKHGR